jgi:hypothetical protein
MAKLQSGVSPFSNGQTLSATDLNNHVTGASPLPDFIAQQTELTSPATGDELLINDIDGGAVKKITVATLAAKLPATTASSLAVSTNAAVTENLTVGGNTTLGDSASDTATINAAATFGAAATFSGATTLNGAISANNDATLGQAAVSGTYTRVTTTLTVTKAAHGLTTGNTRWFVIQNNTALSGTYSVTVTGTDTFTITVTDSGAASGNVSWYERTTTVQSTLAGSIQGDIAANLKTVELGSGDEFLFKDVSDSNKLRSTPGGLIKAWANIDANFTTISGTYNRTSGSTTMTITRSAHGFRVNDVAWFSGTGLTAGWYSIATVVSSSVFTIVTPTTTAQTNAAISWFQHSLLAGTNVYSAYGRDTARVIHVNFTNKPPSADAYIVMLSAVKFTSSTNLFTPQVNNIVSNVPSSIMKTVNGFAFVSYDTGGIVTSTSGEFHVQSIW